MHRRIVDEEVTWTNWKIGSHHYVRRDESEEEKDKGEAKIKMIVQR